MAESQEFYQTFAALMRGGDAAAMVPFMADELSISRLDIHQSNFHITTIRAMQGMFKAVARLVGEEYFAALVRAYVQEEPPKASSLTLYGAGFAAFLRGFAPVQKDLPWLAPVAALDRAWFEAYGTQNAPALSAAALEHMPPEALPALTPGLHPSVRLLRFDVPAWSIWRTNIEDDPVRAIDLAKGRERALLWRADMQVRHCALSQAEYVFLDAVGGGQSLAEAWTGARRHAQDFNLAKQFSRWLNAGVFRDDDHD